MQCDAGARPRMTLRNWHPFGSTDRRSFFRLHGSTLLLPTTACTSLKSVCVWLIWTPCDVKLSREFELFGPSSTCCFHPTKGDIALVLGRSVCPLCGRMHKLCHFQLPYINADVMSPTKQRRVCVSTVWCKCRWLCGVVSYFLVRSPEGEGEYSVSILPRGEWPEPSQKQWNTLILSIRLVMIF